MGRKSSTVVESEGGATESRKFKIATLFGNGCSNFVVWRAMEAEYPQIIEDDKTRVQYCEELQIPIMVYDKEEKERVGRAIRQVKGLMLKENEEIDAILDQDGDAQDADDIAFRNRRRFGCGWSVFDWMFGTTYFKWEVDAPNSKYEKRKFKVRNRVKEDGKWVEKVEEAERDVWISGDYQRGDLMPVNPGKDNWVAKTDKTKKSPLDMADVKQETGLPEAFLTLLAAAKGTGKSTTMVELMKSINAEGYKGLYLNGEEDPEDFRMKIGPNVDGSLFKIMNGNKIPLSKLIMEIYKHQPKFVVIDSAQMIAEWDKGLRAQCAVLSRLRVVKSDPDAGRPHIIMISQLNAKGTAAGSTKIQHAVDAIMLGWKKEGMDDAFRLEIPDKNRGGQTGRGRDFQHQKTGGIAVLGEGFAGPIYKQMMASVNPIVLAGIQPPGQ